VNNSEKKKKKKKNKKKHTRREKNDRHPPRGPTMVLGGCSCFHVTKGVRTSG